MYVVLLIKWHISVAIYAAHMEEPAGWRIIKLPSVVLGPAATEHQRILQPTNRIDITKHLCHTKQHWSRYSSTL